MLPCSTMAKTAGHKIEMLLAERRWKNVDLSEATGINPTTIGRWIRDEQEPRIYEFFKVARALGVSLDWLVDPDQEYPPPSGPAVVLGSIDVPPAKLVEPDGQDVAARKRIHGPPKRPRKR